MARARIIEKAFQQMGWHAEEPFPLNTAYGICSFMQVDEEVVDRGIAIHSSYEEALAAFKNLPGNIAIEDYTTSLCAGTQLWIASGYATTSDQPAKEIHFASHFYFIPCMENTFDATQEQYYIVISKDRRIVFYLDEESRYIVLYKTLAEAEAKCQELLSCVFPWKAIEREEAPKVRQVNFHTPQEGYAMIVKSTQNVYRHDQS